MYYSALLLTMCCVEMCVSDSCSVLCIKGMSNACIEYKEFCGVCVWLLIVVFGDQS